MNLDHGWGWERKEIQNPNLPKISVPPNQPYPLPALFFSLQLSVIICETLFYYLSSLLSVSPTKNVSSMKTGIYLLCSLLSFQHPQQSLAHGGHLRNTSELMFTQQLLNHSFNQKSHTLVSTYTCICDTALPASGMFLYILYFMKEHKGRKDSYESLSSRNHKRIM